MSKTNESRANYQLYRRDHWQTGKPPLSQHWTVEEAKVEALKQARALFGDNPPMSIDCLANSSFVIGYAK